MKLSDVRTGMLLTARPTVAKCLVPGEVLAVRDSPHGLYVPCEAGKHFLLADNNGILRDFNAQET
jgi:hypothetical protein